MPFWNCFSCLRFQNDDNVTKLDYCNSTLTDVPPDVSQFERTLEELYLSSNRISDLPPELFYCQGIRVLKLNDNELENIPSAIGSLRQLQNLDLSRNALAQVPDNIKLCKNLTHLDLSLNNLLRLPDAITSLISLQELLLNETYLEFLPANFGRLVNLRILELRSNNLITLPKSMARLQALTRIDIGANEFTELPEVIGQLTNLRELWIDYNRIRRISPNISNLRELIHFEANTNHLTSLPNEISNWKNLEVLSLSANELENLPFSIGMLKRLVTLKCDSNQLKDLPESISNLENLEEMVINHNFILRLPNTIGMLRKLRFLGADENILRRLPNEICSCTNLSVLSLRSNKITELPQEIGHLVNLRVLNIVDNCIVSLPVSVLSLTQLTALWISDNQSQPLVPLQYLDGNTKTQLTCFMLPQNGAKSATQQQQQDDSQTNYQANNVLCPSESNDITSTNTWIHLQQQQQQHLLLNYRPNFTLPSNEISDGFAVTSSVNSPSRRICFADEAGLIKPAETLTTRLMRSPTPYPKELRLMAKYVRNNHHQYRENIEMVSPAQPTANNNNGIDQTDSSTQNPSQQLQTQSSLRIKEARVLSNSVANYHSNLKALVSSSIVDRNHKSQLIYDDNNSRIITNNNCDNLLEDNAKFLQNPEDVAAEEKYLYDMLRAGSDGQHLPNLDIASDYINLHGDRGSNSLYEYHQHLVQQPINSAQPLQDQHIILSSPQTLYQAAGAASGQLNGIYVPTSYDTYSINSSTQQRPPSTTCIDLSASQIGHQYYQKQQPKLSHQSSLVGDYSDQYGAGNSIYDQQDPLYDMTSVSRQTNQSPSIHSFQQLATHDVDAGVGSNSSSFRQPPPYHIAKAFTKKSREDLLNYDTIRNQVGQQNIIGNGDNEISGAGLSDNEDQEIDSDRDNDDSSLRSRSKSCEIIDSNFNNSAKYFVKPVVGANLAPLREVENNNISFSNHHVLPGLNGLNNNPDHNNHHNDQSPIPSANMSSATSPIPLANVPYVDDEIIYQNGLINGQFNINIGGSDEKDTKVDNPIAIATSSNGDDDEVSSTLSPNTSLHSRQKMSSSQWLFGLHKNPTVKQVIVKKEPDLGFEIKEKPNQGIFISITIPNTTASALLRIDDKLLDVDGYDFTKITYQDAKRVLADSGPVLNVMISRK